MNYTQAEFDNLRDINEKLRAEHAELKDRNNGLALEHTKTSMELTVTKRKNEELSERLARLEERHHKVCMKLDENERTIFRYITALDVTYERLVLADFRPQVDEIGI